MPYRLAALSPVVNRTAFEACLCGVIIAQGLGWTPLAAWRSFKADLSGVEARVSAASARAVGDVLAPQMTALQDDHAQILEAVAALKSSLPARPGSDQTASLLDAIRTEIRRPLAIKAEGFPTVDPRTQGLPVTITLPGAQGVPVTVTLSR